MDIVLVLDRSQSMRRAWRDAKNVARNIAGGDFSSLEEIARFGLVVHAAGDSGGAQVVRSITHDIKKVLDDLDRLPDAAGPDDLPAGIDTATQMLVDEAKHAPKSRLLLIVLLSDGGTVHPEYMDVAAANRARSNGIQIVSICFGTSPFTCETMKKLASGADSHFIAEAEVADRVVQRFTSRRITAARIQDDLDPAFAVLSGSTSPPASIVGQRLTWSFPPGLSDTITVTYQVQPLVPQFDGEPASGTVAITDSLGIAAVLPLPSARVRVTGECVAPTDTPTPTATQAPTRTPTLTPTGTATPAHARAPRPVYLPLTLTESCTPTQRRIDAALVIDASSSMREPTAGGGSKLAAAIEAGQIFLDQLHLDAGDQAAIVSFNSDAWLLAGLSADRAELEAALAAITTAQQTRIDRGIAVAREELASARHRPDNTAVMIVLTDGRANPVPAEVAVAEAERAKAAGIVVFTIGLGEDLDFAALAAMASRPAYFYVAPEAEDLAAIYRGIAALIPCPAESYWGRR